MKKIGKLFKLSEEILMCRVFDLHYNPIMLFVDKQAQIPHARKTCFLTHLRQTTCGGSDPVSPWFLPLCLPTFN